MLLQVFERLAQTVAGFFYPGARGGNVEPQEAFPALAKSWPVVCSNPSGVFDPLGEL